MKVTLETLDSGNYNLRYGKEVIGMARKTVDGFYGESIFGDWWELPTMKALKENFEQLATGLEGIRQRAVRKHYMTVDEARRKGGISHSGISQRVQEFARFHHYLPRHHYGIAIYVIAMRAQARWPNAPGGKEAAQWLADNAARLPEVRELDTDHWDRTRQIRWV